MKWSKSDHVKSGYNLVSSPNTRSRGGLTTLSSLGHRKKASDFLSLYLFTTALCRQLLYFPFDRAYTYINIRQNPSINYLLKNAPTCDRLDIYILNYIHFYTKSIYMYVYMWKNFYTKIQKIIYFNRCIFIGSHIFRSIFKKR